MHTCMLAFVNILAWVCTHVCVHTHMCMVVNMCACVSMCKHLRLVAPFPRALRACLEPRRAARLAWRDSDWIWCWMLCRKDRSMEAQADSHCVLFRCAAASPAFPFSCYINKMACLGSQAQANIFAAFFHTAVCWVDFPPWVQAPIQ